tara:strand:+ start:2752 stop:3324 length:573 start_codon:yes stop_codon:yes gene_type:complete
MTKIAHQGHVTPVWQEEFKEFDFVKQPIKESEISVWREKGYYHASFSGGMYDSRNPVPEWCDYVANKIGLSNCGYVFYKMDTLDIMPTHVDHFETYERVFGVDRGNTYRALVFLEDWKPGHYLEFNGEAVTNWSAGDYALWSADVPHAASNIGVLPRYTLQITGELDERVRIHLKGIHHGYLLYPDCDID